MLQYIRSRASYWFVCLFSIFVLFCLLAVPVQATAPLPPVLALRLADSAALPPITAEGSGLLANGQPFEIRGVNYILPSNSDPACPELHFGADGRCHWDQQAINADLERLRELRINTVRIFLNYYVFGGARADDPSYSMQPALDHLDAFIAAANQRGIYVLPVLLAKYPQDRFGPEHYATALDLHVRPVVQHLAKRPGVLAWDLFNEPDIGSPVEGHCWDWDNGDFPGCLELANERMHFLKMLHYEVKWLDPQRLTTIGMAFAKSYFEPAEASMRMALLVDFFTFHYYDNEPYDSGRYAGHWYYGQGFPHDLQRAIAELHALGLQKPIVVTELGFPTGEGTTRGSAELRRDLRIALQTARNAQSSGVILWPFQPRPDDLVADLYLD